MRSIIRARNRLTHCLKKVKSNIFTVKVIGKDEELQHNQQ